MWVALLGTLAAALAKLGLDAVIQRDVAERIRNSAFARSETALQLAWVAGGALGLLPLEGWQGFALAAVGLLIGSRDRPARAALLGSCPSRQRSRDLSPDSPCRGTAALSALTSSP